MTDLLLPYSALPWKLSATDFGGIYAGRGMNRVKVAHVCEPTLRQPDLPFLANSTLLLRAPDMHRLLLELLAGRNLPNLKDRTSELIAMLPPAP